MTSAEITRLEELVAAREILVFCGSGGVGKTSMAAATALGAVAHVGGKVLVLTIDPARRLASALGVEGLGNQERRIDDAAIRAAGVEPRGELWAAMLDTKQSWDELVLRHAPDEETAYRILDNRMYHNLTARFVQSHDYVAMERLYELHSSGVYDVIVVDTPPTRNAIDFLEAPSRMAEFFGGRLLRWLTLPYRAAGKRGTRVLTVASRPFYQVADRALGSRFLEDIAKFFLNFQSMYDGFVDRARLVERLLHDHRTTFAVVTTLEAAPLGEAKAFCAELSARDFDLGAIVLNRTLPDVLRSANARHAAELLAERADTIAAELADRGPAELADARLEEPRIKRVLTTVAGTFHDYSVVATREAEQRHRLEQLPRVTAVVPTLPGEINDLVGLAQIAQHLYGREDQ